MIEETLKSLQGKGYKVAVTESFIQPVRGTEEIRVVVNNEPMGYAQLRLLDAGRLSFEEIAAQNARGSPMSATTGGGAYDEAKDKFRTERNTKG